MNNRNQRNNLVGIVAEDLLRNNKLCLFLLVLAVISAICVITVTQTTRNQLNEREQLLLERDVLKNEWRNLLLEENVLADQKRIEKQAIDKLKMHYVTEKVESIVVIKNNS